MVDRVRVYACWLLDHPQVTPPQLPGGRDLCQECSNAIWVSNRTREVMEQNGPGKLICNVCLKTKFKDVPGNLIEDTEKQRDLTDFMRGEKVETKCTNCGRVMLVAKDSGHNWLCAGCALGDESDNG